MPTKNAAETEIRAELECAAALDRLSFERRMIQQDHFAVLCSRRPHRGLGVLDRFACAVQAYRRRDRRRCTAPDIQHSLTA